MTAHGGKPVAVVVGGGNGIGETTAGLMAARGWSVAIADLDQAAAARVAREIEGRAYQVDIGSERSVDALAEAVQDDFGGTDALVVTAAVFQDNVPPDALPVDKWEHIVRINLTGTYLLNRAFGSRMARRRTGNIVNVASIAALGSMPVYAYGTSKSAVVALTLNLAGEWGRAGIRVNCVSPGSTLVPRVAERIRSGRYAAHPGEFTALGRAVEPNEVAEAIEFLASPRASAITGVNLVVDAGWHVASTWAQHGGLRPPPPETGAG
jgi:NAD(P)-dependent dehydrogenase (short-subunit alcohol dehydrogenase family)